MNFIFLAKFKLYFSVHLKDHTLCLSTLKIIFLKCKTRWLFLKFKMTFSIYLLLMILLAIMKEKKYFIFSKLKKCHLTVTKDNIYFPIENK